MKMEENEPEKKHGRHTSREVRPRFLSPVSTRSVEASIFPPSPSLSPSLTPRKSRFSFTETRNHRSHHESSALNHGLWPSAMASSSTEKHSTLADHLGLDRLKDGENSNRQTRLNEFVEIEDEKGTSKENHRPINGGYTSKSRTLEKSASSSSSSTQNYESGRFSTSFPKMGIEVSSKYMNEKSKRTQRKSSDPLIQTQLSFDSSIRLKDSTIKTEIKRTNSMSLYGNVKSQWALSPGRSSKPTSFSSLKPKGMEKLINLGFDLFTSKKIESSAFQSTRSSVSDSVHQLRLLHNRLIQWRFTNARSHYANKKITTSAKINVVSAWEAISKLQLSVVLKKMQMEKEKREIKLILILLSQLRPLETWRDMERQHLTAISVTKQCLHSVVCRVPLVEGAKVETQSMAMELRHASDLAESIKLMVNQLSPTAEKTAFLLSELTKVIAEEKLLLEECLDLCRVISTFEIQEMSLKSSMIQLFHERLQAHCPNFKACL